jgi:hypothetical protein
MNWKEYETKVLDYFTNRFPGSKIERNIKLQGRLSKTARELDILLTETVFGCSMELVIECKNWRSKLDVADIGAFIDKLKDIRISKGIIISRHGYTEAAHVRARSEINLQLQVLDFDNMPNFYGFWGVPYRGDCGAVVSAPNGWVVNSIVPENRRLDELCYLHPFEYQLNTAFEKKHVMSFQLYPIIDGYGLRETFNFQDSEVKVKYPKSNIKYWEEKSQKGTVTFRQIDYPELNYTEFTGGVESFDFFAYCICIVPNDYNSDDLARLRYVLLNLHLIKFENIDPTNSHLAWSRLFNGNSNNIT